MLSAKPKSALYRECLPVLNSGRIELLDHPPPARTAARAGAADGARRAGRHLAQADGARDLANSAAGCLVMAVAVCTTEPTGANLSPTPTRRVIDGATREPYRP